MSFRGEPNPLPPRGAVMSSDRDRFRIELDVDAGAPGLTRRQASAPERLRAPASGPFRIALVGDFSARAHRGIREQGRALAGRRPIRVDRESLDDAIAELRP